MSEIPSDVSPALLESPTAHGAVLGGFCPRGAGVQQESGWRFGRRFWLTISPLFGEDCPGYGFE